MSLKPFTPPDIDFLMRSLRLSYRYFTPHFEGAEHVNPKRPALLVGNHCLFGVVDSPLFVTELYRHTGVFPRSLGDHFHWKVPGWRDLLDRYGAVPGTRENCRELMQDGQFIMVFPGGAREVAKRRGEAHKLVWKQRTGFARMAIENGYDILPFASVGCDDAWKILYDANDFQLSWLGRKLLSQPAINNLLRQGDTFMPLTRGIGPTALPRPEPFWFAVGEPIATTDWQGQADCPDALWSLRRQVAASINHMIEDLSLRREQAIAAMPAWRRLLLR